MPASCPWRVRALLGQSRVCLWMTAIEGTDVEGRVQDRRNSTFQLSSPRARAHGVLPTRRLPRVSVVLFFLGGAGAGCLHSDLPRSPKVQLILCGLLPHHKSQH